MRQNNEVRTQTQHGEDEPERRAVHRRFAEADTEFQICEHTGRWKRQKQLSPPTERVSWSDGPLGTDNDAANEVNSANGIEVYVETDDEDTHEADNHGDQVLYIYSMRGHSFLTITAKDGFDGVLELMFFTESDLRPRRGNMQTAAPPRE
jgi:hypothetical protein